MNIYMNCTLWTPFQAERDWQNSYRGIVSIPFYEYSLFCAYGNKQMYSLRLYKYRDSYVLYTLTVQLFSPLLHTHTLLLQTHKHDVSAPCVSLIQVLDKFGTKFVKNILTFNKTLETNSCKKYIELLIQN